LRPAGPTTDDNMSKGKALSHTWQRRSGAALLGAVILLLAALGGRVVYINSVPGPRLVAAAQQQRLGRTVVSARRGTIFDARGRVLAVSLQMPDVFVDPGHVQDIDSLAVELGARLNVSSVNIADAVRRRAHTRFVPIARRVDSVTADAARTLRSQAVGLIDGPVRTYPTGEVMAHVLGFVGSDNHGLEGLELTYDEHLSGQDGRRSTIRDGRRRVLWPLEQDGHPPVDGGHVVLTVDAEIQRIAKEALEDAVASFEAESGVAIVMSPTTGDVLAMVCTPSYDPHNAATTPEELRRNRAVTDPTEPGSTFKPFIASGALDGGYVPADEKIDCKMGSYRFGRRLVTDVSPHGMMNLSEIVTKSSNIGMGLIAERMGNEALYDTIRRFGFGDPVDIDYPGESAGVVYPLSQWTSYSATSVSFGYEVAVTPLQLLTAFCSLVNDGILLRPRLVGALLAPDGRVVKSFDSPEIVRRVVSSETARLMAKEVLVAVVEGGSGRQARLRNYRVLGKTGTAKLPYTDRGGYESDAYLATFVGAAPVDDPRVAAVVMVRRPNARLGYYGGTVAAPAVATILEEALMYLEVPPERPTSLAGL